MIILPAIRVGALAHPRRPAELIGEVREERVIMIGQVISFLKSHDRILILGVPGQPVSSVCVNANDGLSVYIQCEKSA